MSFLKRLGYYLVGLALGLIFLAFFLNRKRAQFCYMPNCRVLKELRSKPLLYSNAVLEELEQQGMDSTDILYFLSDGNVDFGDSDTQSDSCRTYIIDARPQEKKMRLTLVNCDSLVTARDLKTAE